jgi:NTE family protein
VVAGRKRVFILGGGASFGAHHVGAMRFLDEQGIRPDAIIGSSIGVINACLYASGGLAVMERGWREFSSLRKLIGLSLRHNPFTGLSISSQSKLAAKVDRYLDYEKILASPVEIAFVVLNLSRGTSQILSSRDADSPEALKRMVRAGYAVPFLFPPVRIRGDWCVDGGFAWNIPLEQAVKMKATEIYILTLIARELPYKRRFSSIVDYGSRFLDVMWRTIGNVGYLHAPIEDGKYSGVPVTLVEPGEDLSGLPLLDIFNVHPKKSRRLMDLGYRDAKRSLARGRNTGRPTPSRPKGALPGRPSRGSRRTPRRSGRGEG